MSLAALTGITQHYPGLSRPALDDITLSVEPGTIVVVVGANGSGKTTAMEILSGLRVPDTGVATICDQRVIPGGAHRYEIGVQLQNAGLPQRLRVKDAIRSVSSLYADPGDVDSILHSLGLTDRLDQMIDRLSGGWQRRVDIALACIGRPRLLILDEPTSGLDPNARADLWEFLRNIRSRGVAVLASTHDLGEAESFADRLVVLDKGRILLDGPVERVLVSAGGDSRLLLTGAGPREVASLTAAGFAPLHRADAVSVVSERSALLALRDQLEQGRIAGDLDFRDVVVGPVRLEDVFLYASTLDSRQELSA
ncbi:ABC transporter ATP-binding protein [Microbacterium sp.]|uniref:ABC transporter ATP-binding protein n=1 Tax=Microbacterium sp. TaxID=51671 RepID=UPI003A872E46